METIKLLTQHPDFLGLYCRSGLRITDSSKKEAVKIFIGRSLTIFFSGFATGKKDVDDGSGDHIDIPKRTTPAKGTDNMQSDPTRKI